MQEANFEWPVAEEGYAIENRSHFVLKSPKRTFKTVKPLDFQDHQKKLLFKDFRDVDIKDQKSIINFTDRLGLLIGPECIMYEDRREIGSISFDFFIREVRDFQEILSLREHLSKTEGELKAYFDDYFGRRFQCDNNNFDSFEKHYRRLQFSLDANNLEKLENDKDSWLFDSKQQYSYAEDEIHRLSMIHSVYLGTCGDVDESTKAVLRKELNIREDDLYYLNRDFSKFCKQNGDYPVNDDEVTDLDFMDYPQKSNELNTEELGYYYLEKWLLFKLKLQFERHRPSSQAVSRNAEVKKNLHQPKSLLDAIYLQFYYSLCGERSAGFCPICWVHSKIDNNDPVYSDMDDDTDIEDNFKQWHHCTKGSLPFYYHDNCINAVGEKFRRRKKKKMDNKTKTKTKTKAEMRGPLILIKIANENGYLPIKPRKPKPEKTASPKAKKSLD